MQEIFGIPTTSIMIALVVIFALCMLAGLWILIRQRVVFRLGVRNIPRRPAQTILIVIGLMLSTLIIAAAFTTGDTLQSSIKSDVLKVLGQTDERVMPSTGESDTGSPTGAVMPESVARDLEQQLANDPNVDGVMAFLSEYVPAINLRTGLSEPALRLTGLDTARVEPFGGVRDVDGNPIDLDALPENSVILGAEAAKNLDAIPGDILTIFARNVRYRVTVEVIGQDSQLTGFNASGSPGGMAMRLEDAQAILGYEGRISSVEITNPGGVEGGLPYSEAATEALNAALAGTPYAAIPVKQNDIDTAEEAGNVFLTLFLIFGLFSISVGVLLIFLIFVMLAAERKPEMGMARAVGMRRRQLTEMFLAEGIAYDLASALVGAALGVGVAFLMAGFMATLVGEYFSITPTASWQSLVIAYTLGVVVTFFTILVASWRVSKLNIVQAIRDVSMPGQRRESNRWLYLGAAATAFGLLLAVAGGVSGQAFAFTAGVSMIPFGVAVLLRRFGLPARLLFSGAALLVLIFWLLPDSWSRRIFPETEGGIEMFFVSGIMLVTSATMLIVWNARVFTDSIGLLGRAFSRWLPAVKTAVAYPLERKGRTGVTIAMFSLVIFSLVMMATISATVNEQIFGTEARSAGWDIQAVQAPVNPIDDLPLALEELGVDTSGIASSARLMSVDALHSQVRLASNSDWRVYSVTGADDTFLTESLLPLRTRAVGYADDAAVLEAVRTNPNLAIVDNNVIPGQTFNVGTGEVFYLEGVEADDDTMEPVQVEVGEPLTGQVHTITIIGIVSSKVVTFPSILVSEQAYDELFSEPASTTYIAHTVRVQPGVDAEETAKTIEMRLISYGVQATSYDELIDEAAGQSRGFLLLIEGFMMLGLVVGVAALGVLAFRSVVERRQQIGMLRAIGFKRAMVAASFLIESGMITILGTVSGTILALLLTWQLVNSEYFLGGSDESVGMVVPWLEIGSFILIAVAAALLMAWIPARRAARVPIAEALRYE